MAIMLDHNVHCSFHRQAIEIKSQSIDHTIERVCGLDSYISVEEMTDIPVSAQQS